MAGRARGQAGQVLGTSTRRLRRTTGPVTAVVIALLAVALLAPPVGADGNHGRGRDEGRDEPGTVFRNVLPPGQAGTLPPSTHSTDQIPLYDGLTPLFDHVTRADVERYFKPETVGDPTGTPEATPRPGLRLIRDAYGVPHIFGQTRADTEFGAGWVAAEDRSLILETIRGPARLAALDAPGVDAFGIAASLRTFDGSPQTEQFLADQVTTTMRLAGAKGKKVLADVDAYLQGINAYYAQTHNPAKPWTRNDVIAAAALIGAVFGRGGGNEANNASILADLRTRFGDTVGTQIFRDLREAQDPEAPVTIRDRFDYEPVPTGPTPGSAVIDPGSVRQISALTPKQHMSNVQLVGADAAAHGSALAVMGPQVGYYYPEILLEMDLHGGGLDARGVSFPGTSIYVELGRGKRYAWSATSSGSDNIDQFLDELCNPDGSPPTRQSDHYVFRGRCVPMTTFDAGTLHGGPTGDQEVVFKQTLHGPVSGTATVNGKPYAITTQRSTRGREPMNALGFLDLNENKGEGPSHFQRAVSQIEYTFNWFYVDEKHISYYSSGLLPIRAPGTDPSLPTLGTGRYEWRGWLPFDAHPHATDPNDGHGLLLNWNNKPAPGFGAADDNWTYGPVDHVQLFTPFRAEGNRIEDVVSVMNKAATQDDRLVLVWPVIARVLATGPAPDARTQQAAALVSAWLAQGGSRLDRDGDGKIDAPGAAILDRAWGALGDAVLRPVLGDLAGEIPGSPSSYLSKDLRTLLGDPVHGRLSRVYCGNGGLRACRASLWAAIKGAADALAAQQGPDPNGWREPAGRTSFAPGLLPVTIRTTNRPTFQQVVEIAG